LKFYFATSNIKKFHEFSALLGPQLELVTCDLWELQTSDLQELVKHKLKQAHHKIQAPLIIEDSSLYFKAWNELPGPLVKWFIKNIGLEGMVKALSKFENNFAIAKSCLGFTSDGKDIYFFEEEIQGTIVMPRGKNNFGWDSIFEPIGQKLTFSEMSFNEKLKISPRSKVTKKFKQFLKLKAKQM